MNQEEIKEIIIGWLNSRPKAGFNFSPGMLSVTDYYGISDDDIDSLVYELEERINEV